MKKLFYLLTMLIVTAQTPCVAFDWAKKAGGNINDFGNSIVTDAFGNSFVIGTFEGTATFGSTSLTSSGESDVFITKLDSLGNFIWAKKAGGSLNDNGNDIAIDFFGNSFVTGTFEGTVTFGSTSLTSSGDLDVFIAKLDSLGNFIWAKKAGGGSDDRGIAISTDISGNCYVTGYLEGNATFGAISLSLTNAGISEIFITKLDASGNFVWAESAGGSGGDLVTDIATDNNGNSIITGSFQGPSADFGSISLPAPGSGAPDAFFAKLDASGNFKWARSIGDEYYDSGENISIDAFGNSFVVGSFHGTANFGSIEIYSPTPNVFVTKIDTSGNFVWAKSVGIAEGFSYGIATDNSGNSSIMGTYIGTVSFGSTTLTSSEHYNVFIAELDALGNYTRARWIGKDYHTLNKGKSIATDASGNNYITAAFSETASFGSTTLTSSGDADVFIAKIDITDIETKVTETLSLETFKIYPNPSIGNIFLEFKKMQSHVEIKVFDVTGKTISTQTARNTQQINCQIDDALPGVYFLEISSDGQQKTVAKVLKQ